jgi:hypothetical protein
MQLIADASWTRPYQTCDIGRVVDASLPDLQHRTRRGRVPTRRRCYRLLRKGKAAVK